MANPESPPDGLLRYLIFFVTSRCNARCATCFYWQEMERASGDLSLDEIEQTASHLGPLETLLLSGGEPTLRTDLAELVATFFRRNGVRHVGLPTNGLLPDRACETVEKIFALCPGLRLEVNVSLDDVGERHDAIRGVAGNFDRALETIRTVGALRNRFESLFVNVETVAFSGNYSHVGELLDFVRERLDVNGHYIEMLRGNPRDGRLDLPPPGEIRRLHRRVMKNHVRYHADPRKKRWPPELPYLHELYRWQERVLRGGKWPAPCPAARDVAVIEPDGRVRGCELRGVLGDLRQCDYDLRRILESSAGQAERREVEASRCSCTHCVFIYQTFAVHLLPSEKRRRWLERWFGLRRRMARLLP